MNLTKEECLEAMHYLTGGQCKYCGRFDRKTLIKEVVKNRSVIEQLINEHFELVEKYTPKKVINRHYEGYVREAADAYDIYGGICPNCGKQIDSYESEVLCVYCEQRLDWED